MMTVRRRGARTVSAVSMLLVAGVLVSGCATARGPSAQEARGAVSEGMPVLTVERASVIDRGDRVDACSGVLQSRPPGCGGGVRLLGWDWESVPGTYEKSRDVRWGDYSVTGVYDADAETLLVTSASSAAPPGDPGETVVIYPSRCEPPEGGWAIVDTATANQQGMQAATTIAPTLDGYATTWIDRSLVPEVPEVPEGTDTLDEMHHWAIHAGLGVINVGVRSDPAVAQARLREVWGGGLCVFSVDYTQAELDARVQEIMAEHPLISAWADGMTGTVSIEVVHDTGGELQRLMDEQYGPGAVRVSSFLVPAG
jgi:hypothetical protein